MATMPRRSSTAFACARTRSPAKTSRSWRRRFRTVLTMKSTPHRRAISRASSWPGRARFAPREEVRREGRVEERRAVDPLDRLAADERGADPLPAPGGARHEVALDERRRDLHVGLVERPVDVDLGAARRPPDVD